MLYWEDNIMKKFYETIHFQHIPDFVKIGGRGKFSTENYSGDENELVSVEFFNQEI